MIFSAHSNRFVLFFLLVSMLLAATAVAAPPTPARPTGEARVFPHLEAAFRLTDSLKGANPFDYTQVDIQVTLAGPETKTVTRLPAFWDGDGIWRVRYTPRRPGHYRVQSVTRNGQITRIESLMPSGGWDVKPGGNGTSLAGGFVRVDPKNSSRFVLDNHKVYYPVGNNVAWASQGRTILDYFAHLQAADENWSRVWMNHWDNKNLDWVPNKPLPLGTLDLEVARRWDDIVGAAEKGGIRFQMTLQHHGQYSTQVNPNWSENPWNAALPGGFLARPDDFFTDVRARALTRAKYRYILARWGYSPSILAWELFNEVQFTDAARNNHNADIASWHREMAEFLRAQDGQHHLITTSSELTLPGLFDAVDYLQAHSYPPDVVAAAQAIHPSEWKRPIFLGEMGGQGDLNRDDGSVLHSILWASLASEASGAAQYWSWEAIENNHLYGQYASVTAFLHATDFAEQSGQMRPVSATAQTRDKGSVSFGPGGGWGAGKENRFTLLPSGVVTGAAELPGFLQGRAHPELFTHADFTLTLDTPGTFTVAFRQGAKAGAHPRVLVDDKEAGALDIPAANRDTFLRGPQGTLTASLPAGKHVVRLDNTGADWAVIDRITLSPFGATLTPLAKASRDSAFLWIRNTRGETMPSLGTVSLPEGTLSPGQYRVFWWDTWTGKPLRAMEKIVVTGSNSVTLKTPPIARDAAAFLRRE